MRKRPKLLVKPSIPSEQKNQSRYEERLWIRTYCKLFKEKRDPIALMQAFNISIKLGIYPPVSILQALGSAFQIVLEGNGKISLDHAIQLKRRGSGNWNVFTDQKRKGLQLWLAYRLESIMRSQNLTQFYAAEQLSLWLESHPEMKQYTPGGLQDQYSRKWQKQFRQELDAFHALDADIRISRHP